MIHADVHDIKEAVRVRKSSGVFNQLQHPVEIQVDKQRDDEYRGTLSAEARPFVAFQANKEKVNYFNKEKQRKCQPDSRLRNSVTLDLPNNYSAYKKEEELSADTWIDQFSIHDREQGKTSSININGRSINDMANATELSNLMGHQQRG